MHLKYVKHTVEQQFPIQRDRSLGLIQLHK